MRFNNKELSFLAQQESSKFEKEGCLLMKQKNDKLFKKGEAFVDRLFRLRGNLLFYFKGKDVKSEAQGLFVLERCTVELDANEHADHSFVIVFEGDDMTYTLCAKTEPDRNEWIQAIHDASYECLKMKLQSLREQVQARTGCDPLVQMLSPDTGMEFEAKADGSSDDPAMEISLAIEGLPNDSNGLPPNPFVVIYTIIPPQQQTWLQHNHTEMVEKKTNPHFLKTIGFGDSRGLEPSTRVRISVYHVKERMTGTMTQMGQAIFTLNDILLSSDMTLKLGLLGVDSKKIGEVTIVAWINEHTDHLVDMQNINDQEPSPLPLSLRRRSFRLDALKPLCENITTRTFRFETNDAVKLLVHEYMAESKLTFEIPIKVLSLLIKEENLRIQQLDDIGQLPHIWNAACQKYKDICLSSRTTYKQHARYLSSYKGSSFKSSCDKANRDLQFVPLNLHLQRMTVLNESSKMCGCYDTITVGAFTAHAQKYRSGGLIKMLQQQQDYYTPEGTLSKVSKVKRACELINKLHHLKIEIIKLCDAVCQEALNGDGDSLCKATKQLAEKVKELVLDCESSIVQEIATKLSDIHDEFEATAQQEQCASVPGKSGLSPEKAWKWTGSSFVKSPTIEPWDMTRVNAEAALVCLTTMVEDLVENRSGNMDRPKWLGDISPAVMKLKSFIEIICQKATIFMSFLDLQENKDHLKLMHDIKLRRDVVFSHAITSLIIGFVIYIKSHLDNPTVLSQISKIGLLVEMEGLLSCHGDETGMLEDMVIAVDDLSTVTFKLVLETIQNQSIELEINSFKRTGHFPDLNRHHVCVEVPLNKYHFEKLPVDLQNGSEIKITSVYFNIGINEQATLAEKFGSTGLQDRMNEESFGRLHVYTELYESLYDTDGQHGSVVGKIPDLLQQLHYNVYAKRNKNVEVLHLASELCRKLNGIRMTCCKSAKDRTAMAVTLEQVQILQRDHNLASHVFMQSLDCFRSEGVRRENAFKNVGQRKYAFNSIQLLSFPKQYRPPNGTYGNVQN